ncbi:type II toxin-antitoxin system VapC family toxin [Thermodesulforhabdus norvegica]|uniref:Ribonuclease VapC n=1 Tax=Thermodesulforhabdus norvegica TaxID=39841 RepID=A0A1I4VDZ4_9BACT|nr:type II toxin-antitoxin system VapC family toxin [Thermodesulforhabdus norvegica]SFM99392.1 Predicted nucleic acid-binding protein, contains PIN domain [Thermodesulforhabdus norvegica]
MLNSPVCLDASFVLRLLQSGTPNATAVQLWREWQETGRLLIAPALVYYEITNAVYRYAVHGELSPQEASELLDMALNLDIELYGDGDLHKQALEIARRFSLSAAYDAHYLALAERLGAEFWTADRRLVRAVQDALPWVNLLEETDPEQ